MIKHKKKYMIAILIATLLILMCGCVSKPKIQKIDLEHQDFQDTIEQAKGTTVNFYMWGGDPRINQWIDDFVSTHIKNEYGVTVNRVPMNAEDFMSKLINEKDLPETKGSIDLLWINGENFYAAKEANLLFGPFVDHLPHYKQYIDPTKPENRLDFGYDNQGYELPYGKAQFVFIYDSSQIKTPPKNMDELTAWIKSNPGKFTYPAPPDFTGSAFVRNVLYHTTGGYDQYMAMTSESIPKASAKAWEYLNDLKPYLWREGKAYPATSAQLDTMLADGEVWMSMSYSPLKASGDILKGVFPKEIKTFIIEEGTLSNTHFLAIPKNSSHKAAALVLANYLVGFDAQLSKLDPLQWGDLPAFETSRLSESEFKRLKDIDLGPATLSQDELSQHRVPELPGKLVPTIEEEWTKNVSQTNQ